MHWSEENQQQIELYYQSDDDVMKQKLINYLTPVFINLIHIACNKINPTHFKKNKEDLVQDVMIHILTYTLLKFNVKYIKAFQNYLYISIQNYYKNKLLLKNKLNIVEFDFIDCYYTDEDVKEIDRKDLRIQIIKAIDEKINDERILNIHKTIYLELLKRYLLKNDFDERGFMNYAMMKMKISANMFRSISSSIGISVKLFSTPIIKGDTGEML